MQTLVQAVRAGVRPDAVKAIAGRLSAGLGDFLGPGSEGPTGILLYHRICPHYPGLPAPTMNVTPSRFRAQVRGLLALGFDIWPLSRLLDHQAAGRPVPPRTVAITFDDTPASVYHYAWPTLRELRVPACSFLATAYLDSDDPFPFDPWGVAHASRLPPVAYRCLTSAQCREMQDSGLMELGPHTHTHADFRGRPADFEADLARSVAEMRARFGSGELFAFPFGRRALGFVTPELLAAARRTGVRCALTTEADPLRAADDPFCWGRFNVYEWDTAGTLAGKLSGWYGWAPRVQEWLGQREN
ncbi:MAG: polysaccharide deacetylase family protein [Gemmataceae bacterium]